MKFGREMGFHFQHLGDSIYGFRRHDPTVPHGVYEHGSEYHAQH